MKIVEVVFSWYLLWIKGVIVNGESKNSNSGPIPGFGIVNNFSYSVVIEFDDGGKGSVMVSTTN